jgi:fructose-1,6-bisphosphatase
MEIEPESLHQRTPLFIGTADQVELAERFLAGEGAGAAVGAVAAAGV